MNKEQAFYLFIIFIIILSIIFAPWILIIMLLVVGSTGITFVVTALLYNIYKELGDE